MPRYTKEIPAAKIQPDMCVRVKDKWHPVTKWETNPLHLLFAINQLEKYGTDWMIGQTGNRFILYRDATGLVLRRTG